MNPRSFRFFSFVIFEEFYCFAFYVIHFEVYDPFSVNYQRHKIGVQIYYLFLHEDTVVLALLFQRNWLSSLNFLCFFVKDQISIFVWVYFWPLYCFIDLFLFFPYHYYCLYHCSFLASIEVQECWSSNFVQKSPVLYLLIKVFVSQYKFQNQCIDIHEMICLDFDQDCLEPVHQFEEN